MKTPIVLTALTAAALAAGLSGCAPGAGDGGGTSPKQAVTDLDWGVRYAACMREKGHEFPDPKPGQHGQGIKLEGEDETFADDLAVCTTDVTAELGERPVSEDHQEAVEKDEKTNDCLRKNGVDVPDQSGGGAPATKTEDVPQSVLDECGLDDEAVAR